MTSERLNQEVGAIIHDTKTKIVERVDFYAGACKRSLGLISQKGEEIMIEWLGAKAKQLEEQTDRILWNLSRPVGWLMVQVEQIHRDLKAHSEDVAEQKYQETELSRLEGEGGPCSECVDEEPHLHIAIQKVA